jgi:hypothetical protein
MSSAFDENGEIIFIDDTPKGSHNYTCDGCAGRVVAVKGKKMEWHFRHYGDNLTGCRGGLADSLHNKAIEYLGKIDKVKLRGHTHYSRPTLREGTLELFNTICEPLKDAREAYGIDTKGYRPDLISYLADGSTICIEVTVTHKTEGEKEQHYIDNKIRTLEFDLSGVNRVTSKKDLIALLRDPKRKTNWIYNEKKAALERAIETARVEARKKKLKLMGEEAAKQAILNEEDRKQKEIDDAAYDLIQKEIDDAAYDLIQKEQAKKQRAINKEEKARLEKEQEYLEPFNPDLRKRGGRDKSVKQYTTFILVDLRDALANLNYGTHLVENNDKAINARMMLATRSLINNPDYRFGKMSIQSILPITKNFSNLLIKEQIEKIITHHKTYYSTIF